MKTCQNVKWPILDSENRSKAAKKSCWLRRTKKKAYRRRETEDIQNHNQQVMWFCEQIFWTSSASQNKTVNNSDKLLQTERAENFIENRTLEGKKTSLLCCICIRLLEMIETKLKPISCNLSKGRCCGRCFGLVWFSVYGFPIRINEMLSHVEKTWAQ